MGKKIVTLLLCGVLLMSCAACAAGTPAPDIEPQISQMKSICELAVMECYYHNVAKYREEDAAGILFWKKDKHFWIEYSGVVELGIDTSLVNMEISGDTVSITIPEAKVLSCTVDSSSLTEDSFIVDQKSAKIDAEDETAAFAQAQSRMEEAAASDRVLLSSAQQRAQTLLEEYVKNIGNAIGKEYTVRWVFVDGAGSQLGSAPAVPSAEAETTPAAE